MILVIPKMNFGVGQWDLYFVVMTRIQVRDPGTMGPLVFLRFCLTINNF